MGRARVERSFPRTLVPEGRLRASINLGNPVLASLDPTTGDAVGVSVDVSIALAERLGVDLELVQWDRARDSVEAVVHGDADIGFFAIAPERARQIAFTPPYVLIEGCYLVHEQSAFASINEVDRPGVTVTVGHGSAYDLYLSRTLTSARVERVSNSQAVADHFLLHKHDVAAGVRQQLEADAERLGGVRLLPGSFMVIEQAVGVRIDRGAGSSRFLARFVEDLKASGSIAGFLHNHGIKGVTVAPPAATT